MVYGMKKKRVNELLLLHNVCQQCMKISPFIFPIKYIYHYFMSKFSICIRQHLMSMFCCIQFEMLRRLDSREYFNLQYSAIISSHQWTDYFASLEDLNWKLSPLEGAIKCEPMRIVQIDLLPISYINWKAEKKRTE